MLGGRISNQDEDEVEDELAALEAEVNGPAVVLPNPPSKPLPADEVVGDEQPVKVGQRQPERQAMLA